MDSLKHHVSPRRTTCGVTCSVVPASIWYRLVSRLPATRTFAMRDSCITAVRLATPSTRGFAMTRALPVDSSALMRASTWRLALLHSVLADGTAQPALRRSRHRLVRRRRVAAAAGHRDLRLELVQSIGLLQGAGLGQRRIDRARTGIAARLAAACAAARPAVQAVQRRR